MFKIKAEPSCAIVKVASKDIRCPICGRKLSEVTHAQGTMLMRMKCPRCKSFVDIDIAGI